MRIVIAQLIRVGKNMIKKKELQKQIDELKENKMGTPVGFHIMEFIGFEVNRKTKSYTIPYSENPIPQRFKELEYKLSALEKYLDISWKEEERSAGYIKNTKK